MYRLLQEAEQLLEAHQLPPLEEADAQRAQELSGKHNPATTHGVAVCLQHALRSCVAMLLGINKQALHHRHHQYKAASSSLTPLVLQGENGLGTYRGQGRKRTCSAIIIW